MSVDAARSILEQLAPDVAPPPPQPSVDDITPFRERMDAIDLVILHLINERSHCANFIGSVKKVVGLPVYVPSREAEVISNVTKANAGPLPCDAVRRVFERIIDETRSHERHLYQNERTKPLE